MNSDLRFKLTLFKWMFICGCFAAVVTNLVLFATQGTGWLTNEVEPAQDEEQVASLEPTPYVAEIGAALRTDPVWIDPLIADTAGAVWIDEAVISEVESSSTPVLVAVIPSSDSDGNAGDQDLIIERLQEATGLEGVYFLLGPRSMSYDTSVANESIGLDSGFIPVPSSSALAKAIAEVDGATVEATDQRSSTMDRVWQGVVLGLPYLVVSWFVARWITRAGRRDTSYLQGFTS